MSIDDDVNLSFSGALDENFVWPTFANPVAGRLNVNLEAVQFINSLGSRRWIQWIQSAKALKGVFLQHCSHVFIRQISILAIPLPTNVQLESFFISYTCTACSTVEKNLLERGKNFSDLKALDFPESKSCPKCGGKMEFDENKSRLLQFLRR